MALHTYGVVQGHTDTHTKSFSNVFRFSAALRQGFFIGRPVRAGDARYNNTHTRTVSIVRAFRYCLLRVLLNANCVCVFTRSVLRAICVLRDLRFTRFTIYALVIAPVRFRDTHSSGAPSFRGTLAFTTIITLFML